MSIDYVHYDSEVDALRIATNSGGATSSSLWYNSEIVVDLATEDGQDIVGLGVLCASVYLPLGKRGYDAESDTLLMGEFYFRPSANHGERRLYRVLEDVQGCRSRRSLTQ